MHQLCEARLPNAVLVAEALGESVMLAIYEFHWHRRCATDAYRPFNTARVS